MHVQIVEFVGANRVLVDVSDVNRKAYPKQPVRLEVGLTVTFGHKVYPSLQDIVKALGPAAFRRKK